MAKLKICGIYRIVNIVNEKIYIGQSVDIEKRWIRHKRDLKNNRHDNSYLQNSWNEHGENNFIFEIIEECDSNKEILKEREQYWMDFTNCYDDKFGYNICKEAGGSMLGFKFSPESLQKMSISHKGERNHNFGKVLTPEERQRISETHADMSGEKNPMFNKIHSFESKQKMREKRIGKTHTPETKQKMSKKRSGENAPSSNHTWEEIEEIRYNFENRIMTRDQLQEKYKMSRPNLNKILRNEIWKLENRPKESEDKDQNNL